MADQSYSSELMVAGPWANGSGHAPLQLNGDYLGRAGAERATGHTERARGRCVIDLSGILSLVAVAEGMETGGKVDIVKVKGCDGAQGFYFSGPVTAKTFSAQLNQQPKFIIPMIAT